MLLEVSGRESLDRIPDAGRYLRRIEALTEALSAYLPVPAVQKKLVFHYERQGDFADAEDVLFELVDAGHEDVIVPGIELYQRLLAKSDDELAKGQATARRSRGRARTVTLPPPKHLSFDGGVLLLLLRQRERDQRAWMGVAGNRHDDVLLAVVHVAHRRLVGRGRDIHDTDVLTGLLVHRVEPRLAVSSLAVHEECFGDERGGVGALAGVSDIDSLERFVVLHEIRGITVRNPPQVLPRVQIDRRDLAVGWFENR